jgi:sugar fermentation stimulation protein A
MVIIAKELISAVFVERLNRFVGIISINGVNHKCHILNPGRMIKFLTPGAKILVEDRTDPKRKLSYSLIYVIGEKSLILIDSIVPNQIVKEALINRKIKEFKLAKEIKWEQKYGQKKRSRIDFLLDSNIYIEVKATNFCADRVGYFPDAPSTRAQKHVKELTHIIQSNQGQAAVIFLSQREDIEEIRPFDEIDPKFGILLRQAADLGLVLLAYSIKFINGGLQAELGKEIPVVLK